MIKLIDSIIVGAIVGCIAGKIMESGQKSFWMNALLGLVGSAVGGVIGHILPIGGTWIGSMILAIIGSCLVIFVVRKMKS